MADSTSIATKFAENWIDKAIKESSYLCCFKSYIEDFEKERSRLSASVDSLQKEIEKARNRNEHIIDPRVQHWLDVAKGLTQEDTKVRKKWVFSLFTNCYWQHQRGKELERKTQEIPKLIKESESFTRVAHSAGLPGIEYHTLPNFIHFESRKSKFEELKKALEDENNHMIGLQGMGGTGKTTMATEVGKQVEQSKLFNKVIFTVVSNPPNVKSIRSDIISHLDLPLKEEELGAHAKKLWATLVNIGKKVLIILDNVWDKELDLKGIGIPVGRHEKGCCSVLLTTRDLQICKEMKCQKTIQVDPLSEEDALNLLLLHVGSVDCSNDFKEVGLDIVNECGRLPVAIVAIAKALYLEPLKEWEAALMRLKNFELLEHDIVVEHMTKAYNSLRLSYDNLKDKEAQELFLLCSLFPKDYEIPIELLSKFAIGLGLCGEANNYSLARNRFDTIKNKLINSCLLLKVEKECVKMHDLVREVAHLVGRTKIQVIMDFKTTLKENTQYSAWNVDQFPNCLGGRKLEFLLAWVNANDSLVVPDALFDGMTGLRVLLLICMQKYKRTPAPLLLQSIPSLKNVGTLILKNWGLGDLSIVGNLKCLRTLELNNCSIIELPNEVGELEKLRLLSLIECVIEQNNPFKVIARCLRLEELYYVDNDDMIARGYEDDELPQNITLPQLQRYHIVAPRSVDLNEIDASILRCFDLGFSKNIFSEETFKSMATRAIVLQSNRAGDNQTWTNLIPDIVRMEDGIMKDLTRVFLSSWPDIECLINTKHLQPIVSIFSKLVELELINVNVKELCYGPLPIDFLRQLENLHLQNCLNMESTLFKGKLDLSKLKSIYLEDCSVASLFHPSTAQSLEQLEELTIWRCFELEYIITDDGEGGLYQKEKEILSALIELDIYDVPKLTSIIPEWYHPISSVVPGSSTTTTNANTASNGSKCLLRPPLNPRNLRRVEISYCSNLTSLFTMYIASLMLSLEELEVYSCDELEHIIAKYGAQEKKVEDHHQHNLDPMLPKLKRISLYRCDKLEFILPISLVEHLPQLEEVIVRGCVELKYIYGQYPDEGILHQIEKQITLPSLTVLEIYGVPKFIGIYPESYNPKSSIMQKSSPIITRDDSKIKDPSPSYNLPWVRVCCFLPKLSATTTDNFLDHTASQALKTEWVFNITHCLLRPPLNPRSLRDLEICDCPNLTSLFTLPIASSMLLLESLRVQKCHGLKQIVIGEGDGYSHMNCSFIFPKLCQVWIEDCDLLESLFPASHVRTLEHLEDLQIYNAHKLRYLFEKCCCKDNLLHQNQNVEIHLDLPALKQLYLVDVPNMVNICMTTLSLKTIILRECPQFTIRPFMDFKVGWDERQDLTMKKAQAIIEMQLLQLHDIELHNIDIDTIYNLERPLQSNLAKMFLHNLQELRDVCVGPKYTLSLQNLQWLRIIGCKKLRVIFSTSILKSLPQLKELWVSECEELIHFIEENEQNLVYSLQICFPQLSSIEICECKNLKSLFSISTCGRLPGLERLTIEDAPELVQVFECEQGEAEHLVMENVLPVLSDLQLINLQSLESVCQGIDFKRDANHYVHNCPKISLTSFIESEDPNNEGYEAQVAPYERKMTKSKIEAAEDHVEKDLPLQEHSNSLPNLTESTKAPVDEIVEQDPISYMSATRPPSSNLDMSKAIPQQTPSLNIEAGLGEGPSSKYCKETLIIHSEPEISHLGPLTSTKMHEKDSKGDQKVLGESLSTNEASGRVDQPLDITLEVEEPTSEERSNKIALEDNSSLDKLICKEAKAETTNIEVSATEGPLSKIYNKATSSTHSEPEMLENKSMGDQQLGESIGPNKTPRRVDKPMDNIEEVEEPNGKISSKERSDKAALEDNSSLISLICTSENPQVVNATTYTELEDSQSKRSNISKTTNSLQEDDLIRLFHIIEGGVDMEVGIPCVSKMATYEDDNKVVKAFADLEASLKLALNEIASSEDNILRLENALSLLSTYCFEEGAPSHVLKATIDSLHQEIQSIISSFKHASATIHTFSELEEKEKSINVQCSQRKEAAVTLVSKIFETKRSMAEAQQKEVELKEKISRLQVELSNIEKEIKDYEIKLSSLQQVKKNSVSDTIKFTMEFEAVKRDKFQMVEKQIKARQELESVDVKWSSCVASLKKTTLLLGIYLKQKL